MQRFAGLFGVCIHGEGISLEQNELCLPRIEQLKFDIMAKQPPGTPLPLIAAMNLSFNPGKNLTLSNGLHPVSM